MPRRGINLPEETWRKIKALAAAEGKTISEWFSDLADRSILDSVKDAPKVRQQVKDTFEASIPATFRPVPKPGKK
ncbi:MAG TPA: hypothetical protein VFP22_02885 [Candidatus Limnocylindrales bacterium]|nr:hypothetical protein [Candidatus Limnocylindrales bacterium]